MFDLDHKHPIIFFPIRIESRYDTTNEEGIWILRLRFFPDQITINNFDHRLIRKEVEDARDYWKTIGGTSERNSAWTKLANQYGLPRAAYITKAVINYNPDSEPDPTNPSLKTDDKVEIRKEEENHLTPTCKLLPNRFVVYAKFKDPTLGILAPFPFGKDIAESLPLDPIQSLITPESPNWVTDFGEALQKGMAIEIKLNEQQYKSGFEYIIVFGVREDLSPESTKQAIEDLFRAHRYSEGMSFVKQGTPTNLTKEKSKEDEQPYFSPGPLSQSDINAYRALEFADLKKEHPGLITDRAPDGRIFDKALGLDNVANGLLNADNDDQMTATCMSYALCPTILSYDIKSFVNIQSLNLDSLQNHFVKYVSAQGILPPIRVGKTLYGILPVTILPEWQEKDVIVSTNHIRNFFTFLKTRWSKFVDQVPTVMNETNGLLPTENLLNILSMEPISHAYYVRGFRSLSYIADFISEVLNIKNMSSAELKIKNKILLDILLKITFPIIPDRSLDRFYDLCPGNGISEIEFPMVNLTKDAETLEPNYIKTILDDIKGPDRNYLRTTKAQTEIDGVGPSNSDPLLLRLLRYSASKIGEMNDQKQIDKFAESLETLRDKKPDRLKALMLQTLDLVSYRLDAWISSFANQRLDHLRQSTGKGLYAGAFGWIENLMPKEFQNGVTTRKPIRQGGYIHAPSYAHAATAAVLRNGYLTHSNESDKKDLLKINLNSERTKRALELINGIVSTPLSELLGYSLERRLHDAELDYLIDEFRKHFPLNKLDRKELEEDALDSGQERIEPRNLTDGLAVFKNWKRLTDDIASSDAVKIKNFMDQDPGWKSFYSEIRSKYAVQDDNKMIDLINLLKPELNFLLNQMDGLSDLCVAESVFQAVSGNYLRSGAVLDGMSADGQIPFPEISLIPRSGPRQVQRIALAVEVEEPLGTLRLQNIHDSAPLASPRKLAEPNLNKLIKSYIGGISFWLDLKDASGNVTSTEELGLTELGLEAIDLLYIGNSELEERINYYGKSRGFTNFDIRYEQEEEPSAEQMEKRSFRDLQFLIKAMRGLMTQGQPLKYSDFTPLKERVSTTELLRGSIKEVFKRYYDIIHLVLHIIEELNLARSDSTEESVENKKHALMKVGFFANEFAVPLNREGNIIESVDELEKKIVRAIEQLKLRLPQAEDQAAKLSGWRSTLETEGEEAFLESLADELSGEPGNASKYLRTMDILIERIKKILGIDSFLIVPPLSIQSEFSKKLKSSPQMNRKVLKWIGKASYVRPRLRFLDEIITHNQIFESANFSFYCDETKFMKSAEILTRNNEEVNPVSLILAISTKTGEQEKSDTPSNLAGVVADEWTDKFVSKEQDTCVTFHYDGPNTEAPQSLLLAVSPNDEHKWNEHTILKVLLETLELMKLRAIDYRSLKELRHFLPTLLLNSHGEDIYINLYQRGLTG